MCRPQWDKEKGLVSNYALNKVQTNPNAGFGRNAPAAPSQACSYTQHLTTDIELQVSHRCVLPAGSRSGWYRGI